MEERSKKTELLVGLFLTFGLALLGFLILQFGSVKELLKNTYSVTVPFPDGTGIKDDTPVMLGGSRIGKVAKKPVLNAEFNGVIIYLEIFQDVRIPTDAKFGIGTAGLLGDSFIEIRPSGSGTRTYIEDGAVIPSAQVEKASGLGGLQATADQLSKQVDETLVDLRATLGDLRLSLKRINDGALSETSMNEVKDTITHLNTMMTRLDEKTFGDETTQDVKDAVASFKSAAKALEDTAKKLEPTFGKVDSVVAKADSMMTKADSAVDTAKQALKSIDNGATALTRVATDVRTGDGLLAALIKDPALKADFKALIANLRQRGVLFYKDKGSTEPVQKAPPAPTGGGRRR